MKSGNSSLEIGGLADLDLPALRQRWRELYASEPPVRMSRELMIQAIAYRIQENIYGGLSHAARMKLVAAREAAAGASSSRAKTQHQVKPGTRFLREWQGHSYEVTATSDGGFLYRGRTCRSLSQIAREITGTRWSGPAFFGLKARAGNGHAA
ncbi:MAG: DUF2924 domain-containing protein [Rhizobiales bacterium]|nr:DUF2924 domain-containing protein [Hyphomicrobiales bacterium]